MGFCSLEDIQGSDHINLCAADGIMLTGRCQQGRQMDDGVAILCRCNHGGGISNVAFDPFDPICCLSGNSAHNRRCIGTIVNAYVVLLSNQLPHNPCAEKTATARD